MPSAKPKTNGLPMTGRSPSWHPPADLGVVGEAGGFLAVLGFVLLAEPDQGALQGLDQQVGQVVAEAVADHDAQGCQVGSVVREGVRGNEPSFLAQRRGD